MSSQLPDEFDQGVFSRGDVIYDAATKLVQADIPLVSARGSEDDGIEG
jgi:hypothetical protein